MREAIEHRISRGNEIPIVIPILLIVLALAEFYLIAVSGYSLSVAIVGALIPATYPTIQAAIPFLIDAALLVAGFIFLYPSPWHHYYRSILNSLISDQRDAYLPHTYYLTYRKRIALIIFSMFVSLFLVSPMTPYLDLGVLFHSNIPTNNIIKLILLFCSLVSLGLVLCAAAIAMHRSRLAISLIIVGAICYALALASLANIPIVPSPYLSVASAFAFTLFLIVAGPVQFIIQYGDVERIEVVIEPQIRGHVDYMPPTISALHFAPVEFTFDPNGRSIIVLQRQIETDFFSIVDVSNQRRVAATDRQIKIWDLTSIQSHFSGPFSIVDSASFFHAGGLVSASPGRSIGHRIFSQKAVALASRLFFEGSSATRNALESCVASALSAEASVENIVENLNSLRSFVEIARLTLENATSNAENLDFQFDALNATANAAYQHRAAQINEIQKTTDVAAKWFEWFYELEHQWLPQLAGTLQNQWQKSLLSLILREEQGLTEEECKQTFSLLNVYALRLDNVKIELAGPLAEARENLRVLRDQLLELHRTGRERLNMALATAEERRWDIAKTVIAQTGATPQIIETILGDRRQSAPAVSNTTKVLPLNRPPDEEL